MVSVTITSTGTSDAISLPPIAGGGERYAVGATSAGAFALTLEVSLDGGNNWTSLYDANGQVSFSSASGTTAVSVQAGVQLRANVTTYNSAITLFAVES